MANSNIESACTALQDREIDLTCWKNESITLFHEVFNSESTTQPECGHYLIFAGRIDNRTELAKDLTIPPAELPGITDRQLASMAYHHWGEESSSRMYGDWILAVWHHKEQKLFLARDHHGNTVLYYYVDPTIFAFSTSRKFLLDLKLAPQEMDELYLAQVIVSWQAYHGDRTVHKSIKRLPPAHLLSITDDTFGVRQYWYLENTPMLRLVQRSEYVDAFREVFEAAVCARLRSPGAAPIAIMLSGGLDSSSVAAVAADLLNKEGRRLQGYTSVPLHDTSRSDGRCMGNEYPLAEATARFAGNIDLHAIHASNSSPVQAIRSMLQILNEPSHSAGNFFWVLNLIRQVASDGCNVLLTGQAGNATISWTGDLSSQPFAYQLKRLGLKKLLKRKIKAHAPLIFLKYYRIWRHDPTVWYRSSAIHPEFAQRINLFERMVSDMDKYKHFSPQEFRHSFINPGRIMGGALHAEMGAATGLEIRDPTADVKVIEFTYSIPDHIFMDPDTGQDRWLIREAMKGRLPEEVRLNRRFGRQAADRVQRLRDYSPEVDDVLNELAAGPAAAYVDVAYMRQVWHKVKSEDTAETFVASATILTRGIMAGLFVNDFYH